MVTRTISPGNVFWPGVDRGIGDVVGGVISTAPAGVAIGTGIATGASAAALAIPIAGAVAAVGLLVYGWISRRNAQKVAATSVVNEAEPYLRSNRDAFLALSNPTTVDQAAALQYFDAVWAQIQKECAQIGGGGGERCVTDRQSGACVWQDAGKCWNWFVGYRDPIANAVVAGPSVTNALGLPSEIGGVNTAVFLALALIGIGVAS